MKKTSYLIYIALFFALFINQSEAQAKAQNSTSKAPITFYFTRHGKTMLNETERVQGFADSPLTEKGIAVAKDLGSGLKKQKIKFDSIYSGDSGRHIQTTKLILQNNGQKKKKVTQLSELKEWNFGGYEGALNEEMWTTVANELDYATLEELQNSPDMKNMKKLADTIALTDTFQKAENYDQITKRMEQALTKITKKALKKNQQNILVVSSGLSICALLDKVDSTTIPDGGLKNASITKIVYANGEYTVKSVNDLSYVELGQQK